MNDSLKVHKKQATTTTKRWTRWEFSERDCAHRRSFQFNIFSELKENKFRKYNHIFEISSINWIPLYSFTDLENKICYNPPFTIIAVGEKRLQSNQKEKEKQSSPYKKKIGLVFLSFLINFSELETSK